MFNRRMHQYIMLKMRIIMTPNDDETPNPENPGDSQPLDESPLANPSLSPERKNSLGRARRENIYRRNQQPLQGWRQVAANRAAYLRPQMAPQSGQQDGEHQTGANSAANVAPPSMPSEAQTDFESTTNNDINK